MTTIYHGCLSPSVRYTRIGNSSSPQPRSRSHHEPSPFAYIDTTDSGKTSSSLREVVASYLGTPYRYGGSDKRGMDCSGFVSTVYRDIYGVVIPRTSRELWRLGKRIRRSRARPGDLVFFRGKRNYRINHVGIYLDNRTFAHAASSHGVIISKFDDTYYRKRFVGTRRVNQ